MKNKVIIKGDMAEIHIDSRKHGHFITIVDAESLPKIEKFANTVLVFKAKNGFYAKAHKNRKTILLHRLISDCKEGEVVDHRNRDTLDNRKSNLRVCEQGENSMNGADRGVYPKGISYDKRRDKFHVRLTFEKGKQKFLGYYDTLDKAISVARKALKERNMQYKR